MDILYWKMFKQITIAEEEMNPYDDHVVGFSGERVGTWGYIELYTTFGEAETNKIIKVRYLVIDANTSYNILLRQLSINRLKAIVSTPHLAIKFPSASGDILTVHVDQKVLQECYAESLRVKLTQKNTYRDRYPRRKPSRGRKSPRRDAQLVRREYTVTLVDQDPQTVEPRLEAKEELCQVPLLDEEHNTCVGTTIATIEAEMVHQALKRNVDVFAWTTTDMSGVSPKIITHKLLVSRRHVR